MLQKHRWDVKALVHIAVKTPAKEHVMAVAGDIVVVHALLAVKTHVKAIVKAHAQACRVIGNINKRANTYNYNYSCPVKLSSPI